MKKVILTGITPSGSALHIGNYFGALKPLVELGADKNNTVFCFVSDLHALTTVQDRSTLENNIKNVLINYLAAGVDGDNFIFFRQSMVSAHSELTVILNNFATLGQMKRMHAYKDKLQKGHEETSVNMGLFNYPILMSADILLYQSDLVPVGADQKQHVEFARDVAKNFNRVYKGEFIKVPEPLIDDKVGKIVGTDGERKMSKSLGNVIDIFADYKTITKQIMGSFTDAARLKATDKGTVENNPVFVYHDLWNEDKDEVADLKKRYRDGKVGDVEVKEKLLVAHQKYFATMRERKEYFENHLDKVESILEKGEKKAREVANKNLSKLQKVVGLRPKYGSKKTSELEKEITIDDFAAVKMRVGLVVKASEPEWSDKLIKQEVDFGKYGKKVIFSALRKWYSTKDFVGKKFVYVTNLPPRKMGEEVSEGMIVAVESGERLIRWEVIEDVELGSSVC